MLELVIKYLSPWDLVSCIRLNKYYYNFISQLIRPQLDEAKKLTKDSKDFNKIFGFYPYDKETRNQDLVVVCIVQLYGINNLLQKLEEQLYIKK